MKNILIIGKSTHPDADTIDWLPPFSDLEKYDSLIIDLTSFPKDYPRTLFKNIAILKRATRIYIRDNKEIFCIMEKPLKILFKKISLNFSWIPFPQKLVVNPMLYGKTMNIKDQRFEGYMKTVEQWNNELYWTDTHNCKIKEIATSKSQKTIAATITMNDRGKIHFLPKPSENNRSIAVDELLKLATEKPKNSQWLDSVQIPAVDQNEQSVWNQISPDRYRDIFSEDLKKITSAVQLVLEDFGIETVLTGESKLTGTNSKITVHVISTDGMVEIQNTKISQLAENKNETKIVFIANTYNSLPIDERASQQHIGAATKLLFETINSAFLTTLSLFRLWKKVAANQVTKQEALILINSKTGEIQI